MNRGSDEALHGPADRDGSFNEAPIHESGKSRIACTSFVHSLTLQ